MYALDRFYCGHNIYLTVYTHPVTIYSILECFEKKSVPGLTQFPFSKESANSPKKCAEQCWKAKIEGGWARDTSGLKASQYKERNGRFVACYCSWTDQYWDDSGWDGSKSTVCIL